RRRDHTPQGGPRRVAESPQGNCRRKARPLQGDTRLKKVEEEEVDYRPRYDPKGLHVTKTKELKGIYHPVLPISKRNACIDNVLSHLYGMQMLQLRMSGVTEEQL
ncbi:hypothetical protein HAX54_029392, partial [Datura stramonium]|nr:hypothetical protein [Datura stramonium]